jgi:molybdenum-dependent DNA-binding transcriptional regulator ModE
LPTDRAPTVKAIACRLSRKFHSGSLEEIETFLAVIAAGSQTAATRRLGRSLQSVNRTVAALERRIGVELVRRTTR